MNGSVNYFFFYLLIFTINITLISLDMDVSILIKKSKVNSKSNQNGNIEKQLLFDNKTKLPTLYVPFRTEWEPFPTGTA